MVRYADISGVAWHLPICLLGISQDTLAHPPVKSHLLKVILLSWQRATLGGSVEKTRKIQTFLKTRYWHLWIENLETVMNSTLLQNHLGISVCWAQADLMIRALTALWQVARRKLEVDALARIVVTNRMSNLSKTYLARWLYVLIAKLEKIETLHWRSDDALCRAAFGEWVESYCFSMKARRLQEYIDHNRSLECLRFWRESVYEVKLAAIQSFVRPLSAIRKWKRVTLHKRNALKLTKLSQERMFLDPALQLWRRKLRLSKHTTALKRLIKQKRLQTSLKKWLTRCKLRVRLADAAFNAWAASDKATGVFGLKLEQILRKSLLRSALNKIKMRDLQLKNRLKELLEFSHQARRRKILVAWMSALSAVRRRSNLGEICCACLRLRKPDLILQSTHFATNLKSQSALKGFVMRASVRKLEYTSAVFSDWLDLCRMRRKYKDQLCYLKTLMASRHAARYFAYWKQSLDSKKIGAFCLHVRSLIFLQEVLHHWHDWAVCRQTDRIAHANTLVDYIDGLRAGRALTIWAIQYSVTVRLRSISGEISAAMVSRTLSLYFALWRRAHLHKISLTNIKSNLSTEMETKILSSTFEIWARQFASHVTIRRQFGIFFEAQRIASLRFVWRQFVNVSKLESIGSDTFNRRLLTKSLRAFRAVTLANKRNSKLADTLQKKIHFKSIKARYFKNWRHRAALRLTNRIRGEAIENSRYHCICLKWLHFWSDSTDRWIKIRRSLERMTEVQLIVHDDSSFPTEEPPRLERPRFEPSRMELTELDTYNISESSAELSRWPTMTEHFMHGMTEIEPIPLLQSESQFYSFNTTATSTYSQTQASFLSREHLARLLKYCIPDPKSDSGFDPRRDNLMSLFYDENRSMNQLAGILRRKSEVLSYHQVGKRGIEKIEENCDIVETARYIFASKSDWISSFYLKKILFEKRLTRIIYVAAFTPKSRSTCNPIRLQRLSNLYKAKLIRPWFANWRARASENQIWARTNITVALVLNRYLQNFKTRWLEIVVRRKERIHVFYNSLRITSAQQCIKIFRTNGLRYVRHFTKHSMLQIAQLNKIWNDWKLFWQRICAIHKLGVWITRKSISRCLPTVALGNPKLESILHQWRIDQRKSFIKLSVGASTLSQVFLKPAMTTLKMNVYYKRWCSAHSCGIQTTAMLVAKVEEILMRRVLNTWRKTRLIARIREGQTQKYFKIYRSVWRVRELINNLQMALTRSRLRRCLLGWQDKIQKEKCAIEKLVCIGSTKTLARGWSILMSWNRKVKVQVADCEVCSKFWRGSRILKIWVSKAKIARGFRKSENILRRFGETRLTVAAFRAFKERNIRYKLNKLQSAFGKIKIGSRTKYTVEKLFTHWRRLAIDDYERVASANGSRPKHTAAKWLTCLEIKLNYQDIDGRILLSDCIRSWLQQSLRSKSVREKRLMKSALYLSRWRVCTTDRLCKGKVCVDKYKLSRMKNSLLCWQLATQMIRYEISAASLAGRKLQLLDFAEVLLALRTHSIVAIWWREISQLTSRWQNRQALQSARALIKDWRREAKRERLGTILLGRRFVRLEEKSFNIWLSIVRSTRRETQKLAIPPEVLDSNPLTELSLPQLPELRSNAARCALRSIGGEANFVIESESDENVDEELLRQLGFTRASKENSVKRVTERSSQQTKGLVTTESSPQSVSLRPATNAWILKQARLRQVWLRWRVAFHRKKRRLNTSVSSIGERALVVADEWTPTRATPEIKSIRQFLDEELDELEQMRRSPPSFA